MIARLVHNGTLLAGLAGLLALSEACGSSGGGGGGADLPTVPLTNIGGGYAATVTVGGSQKFGTLIDTGSSTTAFAGASCSSCGVSPEYTPGSSAVDQHKTAQAEYGTGEWSGEIFSDAIAIGAVPSATVDFVEITDQQEFFSGTGMQGIMGVGPAIAPSLAPGTTSYPTVALTGSLKDEVGFLLCPSSGTMWLGGFDESMADGDVVFTPATTTDPIGNHYDISVAAATVGTDLGVTADDFGPVVVDTGTSINFVPDAVLSKFTSALAASSGYQAVFGSQSLAESQQGPAEIGTTMSDAQVDAMLPPLEITLAGSSTKISVPATQSYLILLGVQSGQRVYEFAFINTDDLGETGLKLSLFGEPFLSGVVSVFDRANNQVGFAPQTGCASQDAVARPDALGNFTTPWAQYYKQQGHDILGKWRRRS